MDVTDLHAATEDLAGYLSEVTVGDLHRPTPRYPRGIGELIERLLADNVRLAADIRRRSGATDDPPIAPDRAAADVDFRLASLITAPNLYGGGFESDYRSTAAEVEAAFAATADSTDIAEAYRQLVSDTRQHAHDVAVSLGLE